LKYDKTTDKTKSIQLLITRIIGAGPKLLRPFFAWKSRFWEILDVWPTSYKRKKVLTLA
jgi:hypothetical protein